MIKLKRYINNQGFILPTAMMLGVIGMMLTLVPFTNLVNREIRLDHRIAKTKARLNAESGLANVYSYFSLDSLGLDSMSLGDESFSIDYTTFKDPVQISNMGYYRDIILQESLNPLSRRTERNAFSIGEANITSFGKNISILDTMVMSFELESLSEYLYLTNHEHAGGAPGIYGTNYSGLSMVGDATWRGKPCFGSNDVIGNTPQIAGFVQTNNPFKPCSSTSSTEFFSSTVYMTEADDEYLGSFFCTQSGPTVEVGDPILPQPYQPNNFGGMECNDGNEFDNPYETKEKVCFPLKGYWSTISAADIIVDANRLQDVSNNGIWGQRDRLIMTDIEFKSEGGFTITEYWYLIPPYFKAEYGDPLLTGEITSPDGRTVGYSGMLEGSSVIFNCHVDGDDENIGFPPSNDLTTCDQYQLAMRDFHGKTVTIPSGSFGSSTYQERYMMTYDNINEGNSVDDYNKGYPTNFGPEDFSESATSYPNGYKHTNLSHYDPFNFHLYFSEQNHYHNDTSGQPCDTYNGNEGLCNNRGCNWNNPSCEQQWDGPTMFFGPYETSDDPYNGTLISQNDYNLDEAVIYVKGGPVTVHGSYSGRYTVVTSGNDPVDGNNSAIYEGWSTYYRDGWRSQATSGSDRNHTTVRNWNGAPVDTIFANIWITDDLINAEASNYDHCGAGTPCPPQPQIYETDWDGTPSCPRTYTAACQNGYQKPGDCGSSYNSLGLVSAANVIVAASVENRAVANCAESPGQNPAVGVNVHAAIVALNESFVMQYWQHTLDGGLNNQVNFNPTTYRRTGWDTPPFSDGRGRIIHGEECDNRGQLRFWGGIIQNYRGYMMRGQPGPYDGNSIGMDKDYYFDENLSFPPPFFPTVARCPVNGVSTAVMKMISYQPVTSDVKTIYENVD